jgi:hypothetical protein
VQLTNGTDTKTVSVNGTFTFPTQIATGATYQVTVASSPPGQSCWVQNGSGTVSGDVTDVDVPNWPQFADAAFFVNGVQGPMVRGWSAKSTDSYSQGIGFAGIVDVPAGTATIEIRVRVGADTSPTGAHLELDNMLSGANQVASIGAIVLD